MSCVQSLQFLHLHGIDIYDPQWGCEGLICLPSPKCSYPGKWETSSCQSMDERKFRFYGEGSTFLTRYSQLISFPLHFVPLASSWHIYNFLHSCEHKMLMWNKRQIWWQNQCIFEVKAQIIIRWYHSFLSCSMLGTFSKLLPQVERWQHMELLQGRETKNAE